MALIIWKDAMSVGVDVSDADHIIVASLINHIDDASSPGRTNAQSAASSAY